MSEERAPGTKPGACAHSIQDKNRRFAMKIVIAPDSFKESLSAAEVAAAIADICTP